MSTENHKTTTPKTSAVTVWLVDDNGQFLWILKESLKNHPRIRCETTFNSGDKLLEYLEHPGDLPDVILLDINMPGTSGIEVLTHLQMIAPEIRVIMLTVNEEDESIRRAVHLGAAGYLLKTASVDEIERAVLSAMQGGKPIDPMIATKIFKLFSLQPQMNNAYHLTEKEKELIQIMTTGATTEQAADRLHLSPNTIHAHLKNIFKKLDVHSRYELVAKAIHEQLV